MLDGVSCRRVYESFCSGDSNYNGVSGRQGFVNLVRNQLGLTTDRFGRPRVENPKFSPNEVSLRELAESVVGANWVRSLEPGKTQGVRVFEDGNAAITPGNLPNVSAFLGSVSGLLEARLLAAYQTPEFIADRIFQVIPTKVRQSKLIGTGRIGDASRRRNPGDPHARAQFEERHITTPETQQDALAVDVTFEAVFFDQTNSVLEQASSVGRELGLRKEKECFDVFSGHVNPYNYRGVAYNTYLTSGNWINDQSNPLADWTDLNAARSLFSRMTDQETGERILTTPNALVVSPNQVETANYIMNATAIELRTNSAANVAHANSRESGRYEILSSPVLDQRLTDADGLNLAQSAADAYWWMLVTGGDQSAFVYMENWGMTTQTAATDSYTMADHKLMLSMFANQMGVPMVREPRFVVRNKN
jgi:hypothetical protein